MTHLYGYLLSPTCWGIFLGCFTLTYCLTPLVIWAALRTGTVECGGYRKIHSHATPRLGGLAVALPFLAVALACTTETAGLFRVIGDRREDLFLLVAGGIIVLALGVLDDLRGLRARHKLLVEIMVGLLVALSGNGITAVNLPLVGALDLDSAVGVGTLLTVLWVVGITNAVNIIDGMDGLASGVCLIAAAALAVIAGLNGSAFVVLLCIALVGSLLAFLRFNWHPAKIFLGDTGSLFLGYVLATVSLMGSCKTTGAVLLCSSIMALGIPIFETLMSVTRRYLGGFPLFGADSNHTHHRLLRMGLSQRQTAVFVYLAALGCMAAAILGQVFSADSAESLIPVVIMLFTLGGIIAVAGYTKSIIRRYSFRKDALRCMALSRYAAMRLAPKATVQEMRRVLDLMVGELGLLFLELRFDDGCGCSCSIRASRDAESPGRPGQRARFNVKTADGSSMEVFFQYLEKVGPIHHHTVSACLANVFDGLNMNISCEAELLAVQTPLPFPAPEGEDFQPVLVE